MCPTFQSVIHHGSRCSCNYSIGVFSKLEDISSRRMWKLLEVPGLRVKMGAQRGGVLFHRDKGEKGAKTTWANHKPKRWKADIQLSEALRSVCCLLRQGKKSWWASLITLSWKKGGGGGEEPYVSSNHPSHLPLPAGAYREVVILHVNDHEFNLKEKNSAHRAVLRSWST